MPCLFHLFFTEFKRGFPLVQYDHITEAQKIRRADQNENVTHDFIFQNMKTLER